MPESASGTRHVVVGWILVAAAISYLDRVCISTAAPAIKAELALSDSQMGLVFSAFTLAYALFEIPAGWFADRYGARITLARVVVWWSLFTAATGLAWGLVSLLVLRFLFGIGEAGMFTGAAQAFGRWLPIAERGRAFGLALMTAAFGGALSQPLVVYLLGHMSWRGAFVVFGSVGILWAGGWWWWFRDDPAEHGAVNAHELAVIESGRGSFEPAASVPWGVIFTNRSVLALCFTHFCAAYGWYFYLTWLPTYLLRARGLDLKAVGWLAALPLLGIGFGSLLGGWASDRVMRRLGARRGRRLLPLIGHPVAAASVVGAVLTPDATTSALLFSLAAGFGAFGVSCAWAATVDIGGAHSGVVSGAMNMMGNLGGTLCPLVIGYTLERFGAFEPSLLLVAFMYLVAAAGWLVIDPAEQVATPGVDQQSRRSMAAINSSIDARMR
jgi:ACS family glucarate transporter-like MFS transporter